MSGCRFETYKGVIFILKKDILNPRYLHLFLSLIFYFLEINIILDIYDANKKKGIWLQVAILISELFEIELFCYLYRHAYYSLHVK